MPRVNAGSMRSHCARELCTPFFQATCVRSRRQDENHSLFLIIKKTAPRPTWPLSPGLPNEHVNSFSKLKCRRNVIIALIFINVYYFFVQAKCIIIVHKISCLMLVVMFGPFFIQKSEIWLDVLFIQTPEAPESVGGILWDSCGLVNWDGPTHWGIVFFLSIKNIKETFQHHWFCNHVHDAVSSWPN